jgi:hypothetical protein
MALVFTSSAIVIRMMRDANHLFSAVVRTNDPNQLPAAAQSG